MDERKTLSENSPSLLAVKPLESDQSLKQQRTTTSFERDVTSKNHSHTLGQESNPSVSKPPPTAMVAPLLGTVSLTNRIISTSPSRNSKHGLERTNYGIEMALSSPSLDRIHEKACLKDSVVLSPSRSANNQIQSLMNSLSERSLLIERQQLTISRLQQECRERDTQLRRLRSIESSEITCSDHHSINTAISPPVKIDMLSRRLDSLHYELDKKEEELETTSVKLKDEEQRSSVLSKQLKDSQSCTSELEQKIEKLQGYLGNMPTMEEHYSLKEEVTSLTNQHDQLTEQVKTSGELINSMKETIKVKEEEIGRKISEMAEIRTMNQKMELRCHSQDGRILELHSESSQLKLDNEQLQESVGNFDKKLRTELSSMRERHHVRFRDATAKLRDQHKEVMRRNKLLEKQLLKNSDAMIELNSELNHKQGMVGQLKSSIDTLVGENQGLLHQNLVLQATHAEVVRSTQSSPADNGLAQKLIQEITLCVDDFESLIGLASSMINGQDPNTSLLLDVNKTESTTANALDNNETETQKHLEHVQRQRGEIERLRTEITDRYADQIANDCTVQ